MNTKCDDCDGDDAQGVGVFGIGVQGDGLGAGCDVGSVGRVLEWVCALSTCANPL